MHKRIIDSISIINNINNIIDDICINIFTIDFLDYVNNPIII